MDLNLFLTLLGVVIAVLSLIAAIYLPWIQGVFKKPILHLGFSKDDENRWLVVVGVPRCESPDVVVTLPLTLHNRGKAIVEHLVVQLYCGSERDYQNLGIEHSDKYNNLISGYTNTDQGLCLEYELSLIRPGQTIVLAIPVLLSKKDFRTWKDVFRSPEPQGNQSTNTMYIKDELFWNIHSANNDPISFRTWLLAISPAENLRELDGRATYAREVLLNIDCPKHISYLNYWRYNLLGTPLISKNYVYILPSLVMTSTHGGGVVAVERADRTVYYTANTNISFK